MRTLVALALLLPLSISVAGEKRRLGPLADQGVPPSPACYCLMQEVGKKDQGLVFVRALKGEEAKVHIDGLDHVLKAKKGTRHWERQEQDPEQYEYIEKDKVTTVTVQIKAYGPYRGGETIKAGEREGSAFRGTITLPGPSDTEVMNVEGECGC